tara:strand:+ start:293 stop:706 length:414 start_codon:yes stop_codon:yes gene_type:complete
MNEESINLNNFLLNEIEINKKDIWSKLNNALKINKLKIYIQDILKDKYELNESEILNTQKYLLGLLEKKIINKNNDVIYNKEDEKLEKIHHLYFNVNSRSFFYKKDKKSSISTTLRKNQKKNNLSLKKEKKTKKEKN